MLVEGAARTVKTRCTVTDSRLLLSAVPHANKRAHTSYTRSSDWGTKGERHSSEEIAPPGTGKKKKKSEKKGEGFITFSAKRRVFHAPLADGRLKKKPENDELFLEFQPSPRVPFLCPLHDPVWVGGGEAKATHIL